MADGADGYIHGHHESVLRSHRWRTVENSAAYLLDRLRRHDRVLDVGCGPGTISVGLAAHVPDGHVTAVDRSDDVLAGARAEAACQNRTNVRFETGDVYRLRYEDGAFDVVHAHQVLQHLADPVAALVEMRRVCRPGGVVAARDADYGGMFWFPEDPEMDEWQALYERVARQVGGQPDAGRRVVAWARAAGFDRVDASGSAWCFTSAEERAWWGGLWADRLTQSSFAEQAVGHQLAERGDLERLSRAWGRWQSSADGWFLTPHGEILAVA